MSNNNVNVSEVKKMWRDFGEERVDSYQEEEWKSLKVGDKVHMGGDFIFIQDKFHKIAFEWRVLDIQEDKVLLLADQAIYYSALTESNEPELWEKSELRAACQKIYDSKFGANDQARILNTDLETTVYNTDRKEQTQDYLFCLSFEEIQKYFMGNLIHGVAGVDFRDDYTKYDEYRSEDLICNCMKGVSLTQKEDEKVAWWLRSKGSSVKYRIIVDKDGCADSVGEMANLVEYPTTTRVYLRLAMWVQR